MQTVQDFVGFFFPLGKGLTNVALAILERFEVRDPPTSSFQGLELKVYTFSTEDFF